MSLIAGLSARKFFRVDSMDVPSSSQASVPVRDTISMDTRPDRSGARLMSISERPHADNQAVEINKARAVVFISSPSLLALLSTYRASTPIVAGMTEGINGPFSPQRGPANGVCSDGAYAAPRAAAERACTILSAAARKPSVSVGKLK